MSCLPALAGAQTQGIALAGAQTQGIVREALAEARPLLCLHPTFKSCFVASILCPSSHRSHTAALEIEAGRCAVPIVQTTGLRMCTCLACDCHLVGIGARTSNRDLKRQPKQGWLPRMGLAPLQLCQPASRPLAGLPWELPGLFEASCGPGMAGRWGRSGTSLAGHPSGTSSPDGGPMGD